MYTILMFGTAQAVLIRGVPLFQGCPYFRGVLISGCPYFRVSLFQGSKITLGDSTVVPSLYLVVSDNPGCSEVRVGHKSIADLHLIIDINSYWKKSGIMYFLDYLNNHYTVIPEINVDFINANFASLSCDTLL